ncbi:hypothetical protein AALP_AA6G074800 [Arabis alpina]|uniref:Cell differentiation protein rcd1 n=1 Tax=Arabis alpina TaxID=50452 RepID=A0A087GMP6_ARAAL|nr:hypothetical protein AALP_AA6G074800 [Arabis alpina]
MELNLPDSLYEDYSQLTPTWSSSGASSSSTPVMITTALPPPPPNVDMIFRWIIDLHDPRHFVSGFALQNLADNKNDIEILPLLLWDSPGVVSMLLGEVVRAYRYIRFPVFSLHQMSMRVYNVLLLFQCIAHHPETKTRFLRAKMPHYFYPLMDIGYPDKPFEMLRLGALGVIAHLLKAVHPVDADVVRFLMDTSALGHCTTAVEVGTSESKILAVFILHKIMSTNEGLQYCCVLVDRFLAIDDLLKLVLVYLSTMNRPSLTLFNLVAACYARLSQKSRALVSLRRYPPVMLLDGPFASLLAEDPSTDNFRRQLIENLENKEI